MENNSKKVNGIVGSVVGKGAHGVKLRLESGAVEWFNYGKDEKAAEGYKAVTKGLSIGDIVVVDAVSQHKNDKTNYYLRLIKPRNENSPAANDKDAPATPDNVADLLQSILVAIQRVETKQTDLDGEFAALKESIRNLSGGLGHLTPSEKAKTCHVLATNLVETAFTNGDIGQKLGTNLDDFANNLKSKVLPLIRDVADSIGQDMAVYEEKITNGTFNPGHEGPSP